MNCIPHINLFANEVRMYNPNMGIIERYRIMEKFSDEHYLTRDEVTGNVCYLKILSNYEIPVFEYLRRNSNPHVVRICDYEERDGKLYAYEEYVTGETLEDLISAGSLTEDKKKDIILQICDGLKFLHSAYRPIIHRDLKPANIIVTNDGIAKIIDYDIAKTYKYGMNRDTTLLGTFEYAAPEQYGFSQSDPRTDIFALGKIIEEICKDRRMLEVAKKATQIDPKNRYKKISDMKYDIEHQGKLWPPPGFRRKKVWHMLIALAYWALAIYVIVAFSSRFDDWPLKKHIFYRIELILYFTINVDIFFSWTGIFDRFPFPFRKKNKAIYILLGIVLAIALVVTVNIINHIAQAVWLDL